LDQPSIDQTKRPPVDVIFPKTSNTKRVNLNFDLEGALSKMLVTIPLREVIKVPFPRIRWTIETWNYWLYPKCTCNYNL
jgi:hypothetical protein